MQALTCGSPNEPGPGHPLAGFHRLRCESSAGWAGDQDGAAAAVRRPDPLRHRWTQDPALPGAAASEQQMRAWAGACVGQASGRSSRDGHPTGAEALPQQDLHGLSPDGWTGVACAGLVQAARHSPGCLTTARGILRALCVADCCGYVMGSQVARACGRCMETYRGHGPAVSAAPRVWCAGQARFPAGRPDPKDGSSERGTAGRGGVGPRGGCGAALAQCEPACGGCAHGRRYASEAAGIGCAGASPYRDGRNGHPAALLLSYPASSHAIAIVSAGQGQRPSTAGARLGRTRAGAATDMASTQATRGL
jgi:hypothetical protein